jgi:hypothetical protein
MATTETDVDPALVEAIARRVVELLGGQTVEPRPARLVDAAELARRLGVDRDWVYAHAAQLGAVRLGGPRGRLRFDVDIVRERLDAETDRRSQGRRRRDARSAGRAKRQALSPRSRVKSPQTQRRASGSAPARSPRPQHPGGSPE